MLLYALEIVNRSHSRMGLYPIDTTLRLDAIEAIPLSILPQMSRWVSILRRVND